ncbi:MAG: type 1 glutamine amidotransferase [Fimbriimonadaceae bacterium]|nr:type 1 glutamine amidotransferase [Chthonomonadaceae bacterium]MCO5298176.1 type 1 glutamine amidotransferase [Fimbriimonadaceae bacterium]
MNKKIEGKKIAILATNGFEESELFDTKKRLEDAGATTTIVSLETGDIKSWKGDGWGKQAHVDKTVDQCRAEDFDALMIPGGVANPDRLRMSDKAVRFVKGFVESGRPIGAICHGPWMLAEADALQGRNVTSYASIKTDLKNAGAHWKDEAVVTDRGIVTSRKPDDIPAFADKLIEEVGEGRHTRSPAGASFGR